MADSEKDAEDRTEAPTPRRLERAREEGQVALSKDAVMLAALAAGVVGMMIGLPPMARALGAALRGILENAHLLTAERALAALTAPVLLAILPVAALTMLGAVAATMLQTGGLVSARSLTPNPAKLNPLAGAKRLVGPEGVVELLRTLAKLGVVGAALWLALDTPAVLQRLLHEPASALLGRSADASYALMKAALAAFAVVALLDLVFVRLRHLRKLGMSKEDLRDEHKETEGDPHVKGRLKQLRMQKSRARMMAAVPKAAVIITNPTHYAVALAYDRGSARAPRVVAKGIDAVALRIRALAEEHRVPVVANPPLARALHKLELEAEVPAEHYEAVARIIAFIWGLHGRSPALPQSAVE